MNRRAAIILLAVATLLVAPALCHGGILTHACSCSSSHDRCGHDACPGDPCEQMIRSEDSDGAGPDLDTLDLLDYRPNAEVPPAPSSRTDRCAISPPPPRAAPYHPSDLPLRI